MAKLGKSLGKISTNLDKKVDKGIVYVLQVDFEDKTLVKIGVTSRNKVEDRVVEILTEIWKRYRYFPKTYVARYKQILNPYAFEKMLHDYFDHRRYETEHKFGGSTEFFDIDVEEVKATYDTIYDILNTEPDNEDKS